MPAMSHHYVSDGIWKSHSLFCPFPGRHCLVFLQYFRGGRSCQGGQFHPVNTDIILLQAEWPSRANFQWQWHPASSLQGWKLISSKSTSHDPRWTVVLSPISLLLTGCNILLSSSSQKVGKKTHFPHTYSPAASSAQSTHDEVPSIIKFLLREYIDK